MLGIPLNLGSLWVLCTRGDLPLDAGEPWFDPRRGNSGPGHGLRLLGLFFLHDACGGARPLLLVSRTPQVVVTRCFPKPEFFGIALHDVGDVMVAERA